MFVTVYTQPNCSACEQTKRYLDLKNVEYKTIDITQDLEGYEFVVSLGYKSVPVVSTNDGDVWSGFRLEKLNELADMYGKDK
jgi:glutaredoxin-like protein NrdH